MANEERIVRYTAAELEAMVARGESLTDWDFVRAMPEAELERLIKENPDDVWLTDEELEAIVLEGTVPLAPDVLSRLPKERAERIRIVNDILRAHLPAEAGEPAASAA